jgi:hypothetical protein
VVIGEGERRGRKEKMRIESEGWMRSKGEGRSNREGEEQEQGVENRKVETGKKEEGLELGTVRTIKPSVL